MTQQVKHFFDPATSTLTYVVYDDKTKDALVIDPVWDYDQASSQFSMESVDKVVTFLRGDKLKTHYILETHAHADHVTGSQVLKKALGSEVKIGIGKNITVVQDLFTSFFNLAGHTSQPFDQLLTEDKELKAGSLKVKTIFTPGHTPACSSYLIGDMLFTGDALFMPDGGTGRCDFPAGSAKDLYHSIHEKLYKLPNETRVFTGHDYQPNDRALQYESTLGEQKRHNIQLKENTSESEFVTFRTKRDVTLGAPRLLLPSVQVNINAGLLHPPESNGTVYLKIPVRQKEQT